MVTVEDHYFEGEGYRFDHSGSTHHPSPCLSVGGLGEGVAGAVAEDGGVKVHRLAVTGVPRSGPGSVLMEIYGISASHIVKSVKAMLA